jgi:hypothetical protein
MLFPILTKVSTSLKLLRTKIKFTTPGTFIFPSLSLWLEISLRSKQSQTRSKLSTLLVSLRKRLKAKRKKSIEQRNPPRWPLTTEISFLTISSKFSKKNRI